MTASMLATLSQPYQLWSSDRGWWAVAYGMPCAAGLAAKHSTPLGVVADRDGTHVAHYRDGVEVEGCGEDCPEDFPC